MSRSHFALSSCRSIGLLILVACLFATPNLSGQNPRGALRGEVEDASGGRIARAQVTTISIGSSVSREVFADDRGEFRVEGLLPGSYRVVVRASGFADAASEVEVAVSLVRDIAVILKPQSGRETVNVQGSASSITTEPIDTASAVHQGVVSGRDLESLPLAARSFANIAYLVPGTEPVEPSDPTKARITAVSTGGSSGLNNELSVDGADNSDDWIGGFLQNFSPDAIQEFAFRTANEDADSGGTTAGSVVITTRHGTNDWHGDAAFYDRAAALNARYPIENPAPDPKQPFSRQNYVGTLGGPLEKKKAWMFASFEHVHENASIAYSPASVTEFNALAQLAADGLITGIPSIPVPATVSIPFRDYMGSLRFDWAQSAKSDWFLRISGDSYLTHNALVEQATLPSTGLTTHNNYWNVAAGNTYTFSPTWVGNLVLDASLLHLTQSRNTNLGFALAFPFSTTAQTISGFETFGDNQFDTPITTFPDLRNQDKYQVRYDMSHVAGSHALKIGVNFIHEPVLGGAFAATAETFAQYINNPSFYSQNTGVFGTFNPQCVNFTASDGSTCTYTPAGDGSFSQNVQRLGLYAQDSWRVSRHLTVNYGLRWQTTFGLFNASGNSQLENPAYLTLKNLDINLVNGAPQDYRKQFGPRLGIAYSPGRSEATVIRAGFGMYFNDLAQNGWAAAFQGVNRSNAGVCCLNPGDPGALIDPNYKTPYALHATVGIQHAFNEHWVASADYVYEDGQHGYRGYDYTPGVNIDANAPSLSVFRSDNRSSYNALMLHLQGNVSRRFSLTANYTLSTAKTWGCLLGELFDYVNGVCDPLNAFAPGDYGPSGEDVRHRFVLAGVLRLPGGVELSTLTQAESARPYTITNADNSGRIEVNGVVTSLDEFRGSPYIQADFRVSRPIKIGENWQVNPFAELFNLFNRNNPGANYVASVTLLPVEFDSTGVNVIGICNPNCVPVTSLKQLEIPAGGLGDFFGPGTTVGIPFAAQLGVRVTF